MCSDKLRSLFAPYSLFDRAGSTLCVKLPLCRVSSFTSSLSCSPPDEPSRIQALAYRSVVHHEEKEHPSKAGVLPGWRPILKEEPKRKPKPKPAEVDSSDDDVPILKSPKTPKPQKTPKTPKVSSAGDGSEPEKKRRGWPKGKPRGKKTPKEGDPMTPADGSEKKRRRKRVKDTEGVSPSAKFDTLVAAIDDIEGRDKEEADELGDENESRKQARRERGGDASGGASADAGERVKGEGNGLASPGTEARRIRKEVKIVAPKVKRATRDEAGEELGALLDKLRTIAQEPLEK